MKRAWMLLAGIGIVLAMPAEASAAIPATLHTTGAVGSGCAAQAPDPGFSFFLCDDGLPPTGGASANATGANAVTVPAKYGGDAFTGLPLKAVDAATMPGADVTGNIALDVDVSLPASAPPAGGYPLIVMMHGCCGGNRKSWEATTLDAGGERWHYSNAWFASRGYVVITYTARGFVNNENRGSTGQTQLDSRSFEVNDYQSLACQVLAQASDFNDVTGQTVAINPQRVVATGGSYGGGFSWLAITDPKWTCNADSGAAGTNVQLAAGAPKYGWTDLAYTLVPTGTHSQYPADLPAFDGCDTGPRTLAGTPCPMPQTPVGTPKTSILTGLYATGNLPIIDHTTFSTQIHEAFQCLQGAYPLDQNPACANVVSNTLPEFLRERSAYYQNDFFTNIAGDASYRVPIFNAATFTDPLFPPYENRRMANRLLATVPGYPIKIVHGDFQHFVQNKAKEWGDLCGGDRHVCTVADHSGGINNDPPSLARRGITTRLNQFIDNFAQPTGGYAPAAPTFDVAASLQVCPGNAPALGVAADEPGPEFSAATFEAIAPNVLTGNFPGVQETTSRVPVNPHANNSDPIVNQQANGGRCPIQNEVAPVGVASYSSDPLPSDATMIGSTRLTVSFAYNGPNAADGDGFQLNSRLYDIAPSGEALMVDRGTRRILPSEINGGQISYELHGNGWRFPAGHRVRIEIAQDDEPYVKASSIASSASLSGSVVQVPIREGSFSIAGRPDEKPACGNAIYGTGKRDRLEGTMFGDLLSARKGNDRLRGQGGDDCLKGQAGNDKVVGGAGADNLSGGSGNDRLKARDGEKDNVKCGSGRDRAKVDRVDRVKGCERVRRPGK